MLPCFPQAFLRECPGSYNHIVNNNNINKSAELRDPPFSIRRNWCQDGGQGLGKKNSVRGCLDLLPWTLLCYGYFKFFTYKVKVEVKAEAEFKIEVISIFWLSRSNSHFDLQGSTLSLRSKSRSDPVKGCIVLRPFQNLRLLAWKMTALWLFKLFDFQGWGRGQSWGWGQNQGQIQFWDF